MRWLSLLITLPLTLVCLTFAVANRQAVAIDLWPFALAVQTPAFVLVLGTLFLGLICGAGLMALPLAGWRLKARARDRRIADLEKQLTEAAARPASNLPAP